MNVDTRLEQMADGTAWNLYVNGAAEIKALIGDLQQALKRIDGEEA